MFVPIKQSDIETFSIVTTPTRYFSSSSISGVTGSLYVYQQRSENEKQLGQLSVFQDSTYSAQSIDRLLDNVQQIGRFTMLNSSSKSYWDQKFNGAMSFYMDQVNAQKKSTNKFHFLNIQRSTPTVRFTEDTLRKLVIKDQLNTYYRVAYPSAQWAYTNYNSINFFTSSNTPSTSALLYPMKSAPALHVGYSTGSYIPSGSFSFDFYINPRYQSVDEYGHDTQSTLISIGTILHVSSTYALSLVPGSSRDVNNKVNAFKLMLQLSHSADVSPTVASNLATFNYPNNLIFFSNDNALQLNNWHHVVVRWGTSNINNGIGTFNIDSIDKGTFLIPSSTIAPRTFVGWSDPEVLAIGNYFESNGNDNVSNNESNFFGLDSSTREGIDVLSSSLNVNEPDTYQFRHPLNAELHDIAIRRYYMDDYDIAVSASIGPSYIDNGANGTAFYLPPFFIQDTPFRKFVGDHGGILQTPFFEVDGTTDDPFNVALSFGVNGHYINLENFVRDFASDNFPRLHHLSGSTIDYTTQAKEANEFLYDDQRIIKRNLSILPCDDGNFRPNYDLLISESLSTKHVDDLGNQDWSLINLSNMLNTNAQIFDTDFSNINGDTTKTNDQVEAFVNEQVGFTPENPGNLPGPAYVNYMRSVNQMISASLYDPGVQAGAPLTIYNRTLDDSSNQITLFNISNLFYGDRITPKSLMIKDSSLSGSNGHIKITLKDDGYGNLYRCDSITSASTWNSVGNVYYNEGIVLIKSPHLYFFGKEQFEISFKGEHKVHVLTINVIADRNHINSSSNPNWKQIPYSTAPADPDKDFVYITNINYHDENYNVIAKAQLAQPIMKKYGSRIQFKNKLDF